MTGWRLGLALWFVCVPQCFAEEPSQALRVSNDGLVRFSSISGETTWTGKMTIDHPRFHMEAKGTASLFGGPAIHCKSGKEVPLNAAKFEAKTQWISLVVLGAATITVEDSNGKSAVITAKRVVYMPSKDRLLIDGKEWQFKQAEKPDHQKSH